MPLSLSPDDVSRARLSSLLLDAPADASRTEVGIVEHFLAIQAQDAPGAAYSLGLRTGHTEGETLAALGSREIARTWPMRGTLHLIPSRDAKWMLATTGVKALAGAASRRAYLGLTDEVAHRAVEVLTAAVEASSEPLPRSACLAALADAGIPPVGQLGYHLLWFASQLGNLAGGPPLGREQTFVSLDTWAPSHRAPTHDEALALIAAAYVRGHGPVNDKELARWTGLGLGESRKGLAAATDAGSIVPVETDEGLAWVTPAVLDGATQGAANDAPTRLLPGFDEFMLGYSEAARAIDRDHHRRVVPGNNGVFKATVIDRGRVVGLWERKVKAKMVDVTVTPLAPLDAAARQRIEDATRVYAGYIGGPIFGRWADA